MTVVVIPRSARVTMTRDGPWVTLRASGRRAGVLLGQIAAGLVEDGREVIIDGPTISWLEGPS